MRQVIFDIERLAYYATITVTEIKDRTEEQLRSEIHMSFFMIKAIIWSHWRRLLPTTQYFHGGLGVGTCVSVGYFPSNAGGQH